MERLEAHMETIPEGTILKGRLGLKSNVEYVGRAKRMNGEVFYVYWSRPSGVDGRKLRVVTFGILRQSYDIDAYLQPAEPEGGNGKPGTPTIGKVRAEYEKFMESQEALIRRLQQKVHRLESKGVTIVPGDALTGVVGKS